MGNLAEDVLKLEAGELDAKEAAKVMQGLINSGHAWRLQGSFGRAAMEMLRAGDCMLGEEGCHDYWGNYVPSRSEVKPGSKGSRALVVERHDEAWAKMLEEGS